MDRTEARHIEGIKHGDRQVMQEVYEMYRSKMFGICLRYSSGREEASDFLHDGFLKVFTEFGKFKAGVPLEAWIATVIRNHTINQIRKAGRMKWTGYVESHLEDAPDDIDENEQNRWMRSLSADEVLEFMNELPEKYRLILNMYAVDGMSHAEIAEYTGMSEGTSKSQLSRARVKLIELIRNYYQKKSESGKPKQVIKRNAVTYEPS